MKVTWVKTSKEVYSTLYKHHRDGMSVHGTITGGGWWDPDSKRFLTEWGLKGADAPLIKSDRIGGVWTYYIASISEDEE